VSNLQSVVLTLALSYALIGALLLIVLVYARLHWSAKAIAVGVTSAFYIASFVGVYGLLGWATVDRLPVAFKLLQARIVEPHSLEGDPGAIYLWVETLDEGNRPSGVPRAYRLPYRDALAEKTDKAIGEIAAGRAQGGRAADLGSGQGGLMEAVRDHYYLVIGLPLLTGATAWAKPAAVTASPLKPAKPFVSGTFTWRCTV